MKLSPSEGQDMMIWFRPENRSHAFTVYYHFILPVPGMVFIDKPCIFHLKFRKKNIIPKRYDGLPGENRVTYQYIY